jgi:hypothetical protein
MDPRKRAAIDFLDAWRFCPVSDSPTASRECLEDAATQLLDALGEAGPVVRADEAIQISTDSNHPGIRLTMQDSEPPFGSGALVGYNLTPDEARSFARDLDAAALRWEQAKR